MADKLSTYKKKRDFKQTQEPSGSTEVKPSNRLRFIIQKHDATRLHYDLRLELDGVFKSWAVTKGPSLDPSDRRLAVEVEDHPLDYGDFEGTIPKGQYGGGTVMLWDRGYWEPEGSKSPEEALKEGDFKFVLHGKRLHGRFVLVQMRNDRDGGKRTNWLLIKHHDDHSVEENGAARTLRSAILAGFLQMIPNVFHPVDLLALGLCDGITKRPQLRVHELCFTAHYDRAGMMRDH